MQSHNTGSRTLPPMSAAWRARCPLCGEEGTGGMRSIFDAEKMEAMAQDAAIFWQDMHMKTCANKPHIPKILPLVATKVVDTREHQEQNT